MTEKIKLIRPDCFNGYRLDAGITTRKGGVSEFGYASLNFGFNSGDKPLNVVKNRELLYQELKTGEKNFVYANQVHADKIALITQKDGGKGAVSREDALDGIDAMITQEKNIYLTIQTADCMSIFIYCPESHSIGLVHAGWKGSASNIVGKTIDKMKNQFCANPEKTIVYFGPSISRDCYEVGEEFLKTFDSESINKKDNKFYLDLYQVNYNNCIRYGILKKNIFTDKLCTFSNNELFFSYRRDGAQTGRMISFLSLK